MRMNAVLSNPKHPEYGQYTVPLPIPSDQYDGIMEALNAMGMGDPLARDCQMDEIFGEYPILKRLEGKPVNIDELDYLAKRLDSFCCALEDAQFQGAAVSYDYSDMADLINLTFSCQQGRRIEILREVASIIDLREAHTVVINHPIRCDNSVPLINEEQGSFIAIQVVQRLFTGAAAVQHHEMFSADLL